MMTSLGQRVSEADIKEMLEDTDTSADGTLDYPAFMSMMTRKSANNDLNCEIKEVKVILNLITSSELINLAKFAKCKQNHLEIS